MFLFRSFRLLIGYLVFPLLILVNGLEKLFFFPWRGMNSLIRRPGR